MSPARALRLGTKRALLQRSKYGAVPTLSHGIRFHSAAEARRYDELLLLARAGEITDLVVQPRFPLYVYEFGHLAEPVKIGEYVADYGYIERDGEEVVEDVKGMRSLPLALWKMKHLKAQYGITVREIRYRR